MPKKIVLSGGERFERLTVIREVEKWISPSGQVRRRFECLCDCGKTVSIHLHNLRYGRSKSCGCLTVETARAESTTHGDNGSPEYATWNRIKQRCGNPKNKSWPDYGGRGINLFGPWQDDYAAFLAYVGRRPGPGYSIDRFPNNDGNYEPGNLRWANRRDQNRNKRNSVYVWHDGRHRLMLEVCFETGIPYSAVKARRRRGWPDAHLFDPLIVP